MIVNQVKLLMHSDDEATQSRTQLESATGVTWHIIVTAIPAAIVEKRFHIISHIDYLILFRCEMMM